MWPSGHCCFPFFMFHVMWYISTTEKKTEEKCPSGTGERAQRLLEDPNSVPNVYIWWFTTTLTLAPRDRSKGNVRSMLRDLGLSYHESKAWGRPVSTRVCIFSPPGKGCRLFHASVPGTNVSDFMYVTCNSTGFFHPQVVHLINVPPKV